MKKYCLQSILITIIFFFIFEGNSEGLGCLKLQIHCSKYKTFFKLSIEEQIQKFSRYNIEEQYDIFICGNELRHPPALYLTLPFAKNGQNAIDFLITKLLQADDDIVIRDIISVFEKMSLKEIYNVKKNEMLMKQLKDSLATMKREYFKKDAEEMISNIEKKESW